MILELGIERGEKKGEGGRESYILTREVRSDVISLGWKHEKEPIC